MLQTDKITEMIRDFLRLTRPNPLLKQGQLEPIAQDCAQLNFEYLHRWRFHYLCEQLIQPQTTIKVKKYCFQMKSDGF